MVSSTCLLSVYISEHTGGFTLQKAMQRWVNYQSMSSISGLQIPEASPFHPPTKRPFVCSISSKGSNYVEFFPWPLCGLRSGFTNITSVIRYKKIRFQTFLFLTQPSPKPPYVVSCLKAHNRIEDKILALGSKGGKKSLSG